MIVRLHRVWFNLPTSEVMTEALKKRIRQLNSDRDVIVWDLPGLGRSTRPTNRDYSTEKITLTFCRLFPKALGDRVRAIALVQTTYTNPVRTTSMAGLLTALERPVIVPLLHLTIWLSPLMRCSVEGIV